MSIKSFFEVFMNVSSKYQLIRYCLNGQFFLEYFYTMETYSYVTKVFHVYDVTPS